VLAFDPHLALQPAAAVMNNRAGAALASSHRTRRWSKGDSNWRSHLVRRVAPRRSSCTRQCSGDQRSNRCSSAASSFGWDRGFESCFLQQPVCLSSEP
jgi:hypothetical protein